MKKHGRIYKITLLGILGFCISQIFFLPAYAEDPPAAVTPAVTETETAPELPEDVDVSNLEKEYWRPRADDLEVIQNKRIPKVNRLETLLYYGVFQAEGFQDSSAFGLALGYNINEDWFIEAAAHTVSNSDSKLLTDVRRIASVTPNFNKITNQYRFSVLWVPIYAKFTFLGKKISHFDTFVGGGLGITEANGNNFTQYVNVGEKFFITSHLLLRLEWLISYYNETVVLTDNTRSKQSTTKNIIMFGLGWLF